MIKLWSWIGVEARGWERAAKQRLFWQQAQMCSMALQYFGWASLLVFCFRRLGRVHLL